MAPQCNLGLRFRCAVFGADADPCADMLFGGKILDDDDEFFSN